MRGRRFANYTRKLSAAQGGCRPPGTSIKPVVALVLTRMSQEPA
jgi:hypothetical protein